MKLLVTGGAGYIGSVVASMLVEEGHRVVVLDDLSTGCVSAVPEGAELIRARIHDAASVFTDGFDGVLHCAGLIAAGESMVRPEIYWDNNVVGSLALLDAVRIARVPRFVFSSSAAVYGNPVTVPIPETAAVAPTNPYGSTKLTIDLALTAQAAAHGLAAVSLRYFNVAGAHDGFGERHDPETHLIPLALSVAAGVRDKLHLYGDDYPTPDGTCIRDYIHVADLARAHLLALAVAEPGRHDIFNLGNGNGFSNLEVVEAVRAVTGAPVPMTIGARREGDPVRLVAAANKARTELGWMPRHPDLHDIIASAWHFTRSV